MTARQRICRLMCIALPIPAIGLATVLLMQSPSPASLLIAGAATIASIALAVSIWRTVRDSLIEPIVDIDRRITRFEPIESEGLPALAHHIRDRIEADRRSLAQERDHYRRLLRASEHAISERSHPGDTVSGAANRTLLSQDGIVSAIIDTSTELSAAIESGSSDPGHTRLLAGRLERLVDELGDTAFDKRFVATRDLRQIIDEAIDAVAATGRGVVMPIVSEPTKVEVTTNPAALCALIINYLLSLTDIRGYLHVRLSGERGIAVFATAWQETQPSPRLDDLLARFGGKLESGLLQLPDILNSSANHQAETGKAFIHARSEGELRSIASRLAALGYGRAERPEEADVCLLTTASDFDLAQSSGRPVIAAGDFLVAPGITRIQSPILQADLEAALIDTTRLHVLAIDDDARSLELLAAQCRHFGIELTCASSETKAISLAASRAWDAILLDLQLDGTDGLALAARLDGNNQLFLLTAAISDADRSRAHELGIENVFEKPLDIPALVELLRPAGLVAEAAATPTAAPRRSTLARFDPELSLRLAHWRPEVATELLEALIESLPADIEALSTAVAALDSERVRALAHRLNGGLQYCGVPRLRESLRQLEAIAREGNPDEIRLAGLIVEQEAQALIAFYDPNEDYFTTSVVRRAD